MDTQPDTRVSFARNGAWPAVAIGLVLTLNLGWAGLLGYAFIRTILSAF